jgi:NAD(P)-dependent dehydrogenase (short-subunit alcohol dehydrogenase family)
VSKPTAFITGATQGIGMVTARALADAGYRVLMGCRSAQRGELVRDHLVRSTGNQDVEVVALDLASRQVVTSCAATVVGRCDRLDLLVNNAGMMSATRALSADGIELTFAVNHLGPFLLTELLLDLLAASAPARIVNVASRLHLRGSLDLGRPQSDERYRSLAAYARSKLANVVYTLELAERLQGTGVTVNCLHPGVVATNLFPSTSRPMALAAGMAKRFMMSPEEGAATTIYLALSPEVADISGAYFDQHRRRAEPAPAARNSTLQHELRRLSARLMGLPEPGATSPV